MTNRRGFLQTGARLVGTALAPGMFLSGAAPSLKGAATSVVVQTHEHYGDIEERLDFPAGWDVHVQKMAGHDAPELSREEIRRRVQAPIGARPLREIAAGRKSAVVTFDDLTRATPTYDIAPVVVEELLAAGVPADRIIFMGSFGTHRPLELDEVVRKLGRDITRRFAWVNHNVWDNLKDAGTTSRQTPVKINQTFAGADLRVTISGIKVHGDAGYGGGAKAILPGVASFETIQSNHERLISRSRPPGVARIFKNEMRLDMIDAARLAKVDFSVQTVYNSRRKVCAVFAGDIVDAHIAACRVAIKHYRTEKFLNPDIVVYNTYPQTTQAGTGREWVGTVRDGGTGLLILQNPQGISSWHMRNEHTWGANGRTYLDRLLTPPAPLPKNVQLIVYSQYLDKQQMNKYAPNTLFAFTWDEAIQHLQARHKGDASVALYPCGAIQHSPMEFDE
jgi:lactate racemase